MNKTCTKCKTVKPISNFCIDKCKNDGHSSHCKSCHKKYKAVFQSDPEYKARERVRAAIRRQDPERRAYAKAYNSAYQKSAEGKLRIKANRIKRVFGINLPAYLQLIEKQLGLCAICGNPPSTKQGFVIDHDHNTGAIRGLLCCKCNLGIGNLKDNPKILQSAIEYLNKHGGKCSTERVIP